MLSALLCALCSIVSAETTDNSRVVVYQENGQYYYRFETQTRDVAFETSEPLSFPDTVAQSRSVYYRAPSSGSRTRAITDRGGTAATQVCGGPMEIVNRSGECRELEYDQSFLSVLQTEGLACARSAAQSAFGFTPSSVKLRTGEGQVSATRRSSNGRYSTHSIGRALDIFEIDLYNGAAHNSVRMHRNHMTQRGHRTFYMEFGDCWRQVVRNARGNEAGTCGSGCLDFNYNSDHHDHMHLSLPPLNSVRRSYNVNCT